MFTQFSKIFVNNLSESLIFTIAAHRALTTIQICIYFKIGPTLTKKQIFLIFHLFKFSPYGSPRINGQFSNFPLLDFPHMGPLGSTDNFVTKFGDSLKKITHFLRNFHTCHKFVSVWGKNAVTRIRTWVTAATTQGPNH